MAFKRVIKQCIFCKSDTEVIITTSDDQVICINCKNEGKSIPKKRKPSKCYNCGIDIMIPSNYKDGDCPCEECKKLGFKNLGAQRNATTINQRKTNTIIMKCELCGNEVNRRKDRLPKRVICSECMSSGKKLPPKNKKAICFNCGKEFDVAFNLSSIDNACPECRALGIKNRVAVKTGALAKKTFDIKLQEDPDFHKKRIEKSTNSIRETFNDEEKKNEIIEKRSITYKRKTGYKHHMFNPEVKEQIKETNLKKYGVEHPLQNEEVFDKLKSTNIERYGVVCPLINDDIKEKTIATNLEKYGVDHHMKNKDQQDKMANILNAKTREEYPDFLESIDLELLDEYKNSFEYYNYRCKKCGNIFKAPRTWIVSGGYRCRECYPASGGTSQAESEVYEFISSIYKGEIIRHDKKILNGLELDIYLPEKNIAIEYDGLYWHSYERINDKKYHLNKTEECLKHGIQLIHIFEDEWIHKKEIVISKLIQIIGCNTSERLHARKCIIKEIPSNIKNMFLNSYHIQGYDKSIIKLGAFYNDELVAVMTFSHGSISKGTNINNLNWELSRFTTNYNYRIPGIASKLLEYFKRNYEWNEIFSYADRRWSVGNVYEKLGFEFVHNSDPSYWYIKGSNRIHRFILRKRIDEPRHISEFQLRKEEGYIWIYDCGTIKYILRK